MASSPKHGWATRRRPFLIAFGYVCALVAIRLAVLIAGSAHTDAARAASEGGRPDVGFAVGANIILFGYHIHHFYFGLALLVASGWMAIVESERVSGDTLAVIFGVGLGLVMDEIGLLLTWGDYYSRATYLVSLLLLGIFLNVVLFADFWRAVRAEAAEQATVSPFNAFIADAPLIAAIGELVNKTTTQRLALVFTALVYLTVGILILVQPKLLYYWIAGAFLLHGASLLVRAWSTDTRG